VFVLLRRFGASLEEQIAGLLHDVSHTIYSHVGDFVFSHYFDRYSYQDDIHEWFLEKTGTMEILRQYDMATCCSEYAKKNMRMLEQDKPDLCMDRIEYLLRGGLYEKILTEQDILTILDDLYFENGLWICKTKESALKIGLTSLWLSEHIFTAAWNAFTYTHAANALKRALELNIITLDDIHFSTDDVIWQKLKSQNDAIINICIDKVEHYENYFVLGDENNHMVHYNAKSLGVNPWVETDNGIERLSFIDGDYEKEYLRIAALAQRGWYLITQDLKI
jgi:HD superfamily phosphohydrolase